jgi:hypothetical protein
MGDIPQKQNKKTLLPMSFQTLFRSRFAPRLDLNDEGLILMIKILIIIKTIIK